MLLDRDEHIREGVTPASLAELGEVREVRHLHTRATSPALADAGLVVIGTEAVADAAGLTFDDLGVIEFAEAFAAVSGVAGLGSAVLMERVS
ncbi:MAG: hypothetical protein ACRDQ7_13940 [Haloechinothrix sp.]